MSSPGTPVLLHDRWMRVPLENGHGDFHFRWLRHQCDLDRHPTTGERIVDSSEIPHDVRAAEATIEGDALLVRWLGDDRTSRYPLSFLEAHAYGRDRASAPPPPSDVEAITLTLDEPGVATVDAAVESALARLDRHGAVLVRRADGLAGAVAPEDETQAIIDAFSARGLRVIPTHFGAIEDLRPDNTTNANTDQLGYTNAAIDLHTDQPFLQEPPRLQLLQSIRPAAAGGDNYIVDGLAAAQHLASVDRRAYDLLTTVPVRFHRKQKAFESLVVAPILDFSGPSFRIRYSYFTMDPYDRPFDEMEDWYRAYDRFAELVRHPGYQLRFGLNAGDFLLYDNHRMLHARTAFRGGRWVRGIYFDRLVSDDQAEELGEQLGLLASDDQAPDVADADADRPELGAADVGAGQLGAGKIGALEVTTVEDGAGEIGAAEIRLAEATGFEAHLTKTRVRERRIVELALDETNALEPRFDELYPGQTATAELDAREIGGGPFGQRRVEPLGQHVEERQAREMAVRDAAAREADAVHRDAVGARALRR